MNKKIKFIYVLLIIVIVGGGVVVGLQNKINESREGVALNYFSLISNKIKNIPICDETMEMETIKKDIYPYATYDLFNSSNQNLYAGSLVSMSENRWFSNDLINQTIVFELVTDHAIGRVIHFLNKNNNIPDELLNEIDINVEEGKYEIILKPARIEDVKNSLSDFIKLSKKIDKSFFATQKGISLNDPKDKIIGIYGEPDSEIILSNGILKAEWFFNGNYMYDDSGEFIDWGYRSKCGRPLVEELSGYKLRMFFEDGKLIGSIIDYYTL